MAFGAIFVVDLLRVGGTKSHASRKGQYGSKYKQFFHNE
jgi:hypothetical protein